MLEFLIFAVLVTCIAGMITRAQSRKRKKEAALPIWERENGKEEIEIWLVDFLAKLKRTSTRTQKCRLILSVERMQFEDDWHAVNWQYVRFGKDEAEIFWENTRLQKMILTEFQKHILKSNDKLKGTRLSRSEIKEESGIWEIPANLKGRIISEGGEALVFSSDFGNIETAVRVQIFDTLLFTNDICLNSLSWKIHSQKDFEKIDYDKKEKENLIPIHENIIKNFVNVELFHKADLKQEDCVGWITIMEKADDDLRTILQGEKIDIGERKKIAIGIMEGFTYLADIGLGHYDFKMENILLVDGIPKISDFGLVYNENGVHGFYEFGYTRKGSKFRNQMALSAATPGFAYQDQLTNGNGYQVHNLWYFLFCNWQTAWTLLYKPIDYHEREEIDVILGKCNALYIHSIKKRQNRHVIMEITSIITIPSSSSIFCLDDRNLTKSCNMSNIKQKMTKCFNQDLQNLTKNVLDQKSSNLCVPISVTSLLRFAMKNDLGFDVTFEQYSAEKILAVLTFIVFPRSMAGLNLNPNKDEKDFQTTEIEVLLQRICKETYLMPTGWEIIRKLYFDEKYRPLPSSCKFEKIILNESFDFIRPLTVTGACFLPDRIIDGTHYPAEIFFHQMVLDRIENPADYNKAQYVICNTSFQLGGPVLKIPKTRAYYVNELMMLNNQTGQNEFKFYGPQPGDFMWLVNEKFGNMQPNTWYLLPQAYSITLVPQSDDPVLPPDILEIGVKSC